MTTTRQDLERESTQYALDEAKQAQKRHGLTDIATAMYMEAAELGFMYAATAREKEIEELNRDKKLLAIDLDKLIVQNRKLFDAVNENQERIDKLQAAIRHANSSLLDYDDVEWETWNNMPGVRDALEYGQ